MMSRPGIAAVRTILISVAAVVCAVVPCFATVQDDSVIHRPYYQHKADRFESYTGQADVVMIGDSITEGAEWHEMFPGISIVNRGIRGDTTAGLLNRLHGIVQTRADKAFVMIGINDFARERSVDEVFGNYQRLIVALRSAGMTPYIQATLYAGSDRTHLNPSVAELNQRLSDFSDEQEIVYLDLNPVLAPDGVLLQKYSLDKLHLNAAGFNVWHRALQPYLEVTTDPESGSISGDVVELDPEIQHALRSERLSFTTVFDKDTVGNGYANFRIPALVVSKQGTLLAFAEGRRVQSDHNKGPLVLRRSKDGGESWLPLQVIVQHGSDSLNNPTPVVLENGDIIVLYQRFPEGYHSREIPDEGVEFVAPGHSGSGVQTNHMITSVDDGLTWSDPIDITAESKRPAPVYADFSGPGPALVLQIGKHAGRIIVPSCDFTGDGQDRVFRSYATYSDDGGKTWQLGEYAANPVGFSANETQMVELADGRLMMDVRALGNRRLAYSSDGGETWSDLKSQADLPDSSAMGSVIRYDMSDGTNLLLHSGATVRIDRRRYRGAVYVSFDSGESWPRHRVYHPGSYDYSSIVRLPDGDIGILGEFDFGVQGRFNDIRFVRIDVEWLLGE